jgi:hypothetical protein
MRRSAELGKSGIQSSKKFLAEEILRSLRESLAHLDSLHMIDSDGPEVAALKQRIREQIRELEQCSYRQSSAG